MKCKNCGGELLHQEGRWFCQSCESVFKPEKAYETIDVTLCYIETDTDGRRTKDSIVAQEVYRKLEENKIATFYERISASTLTGDDLEMVRIAAICDAKAVLVLGASAEHFNLIEERYSVWLAGKTVIPFCVDVNPGQIPPSLRKIQAVNYTTIGWEKDLVKGLYNILGRKQEVDTGALYGKTRRKKLLVIGILAAVLVIGAVVAFLLLKKPPEEESPATEPSVQQTTETATEPTTEETEAETEPPTTQPPTPQDIYDQAAALMDEGKLTEALELFWQIPEHPASANQIKLIYAKFSGYYGVENANFSLHITSNAQAEVNLSVNSETEAFSFTLSTTVNGNQISGDFRDRTNRTGTVELALEDAGIQLVYRFDDTEEQSELFFPLAGRSDEPLVTLDRQTLLSWLNNSLTIDDIRAQGYDLVEVWVHYLRYYCVYNIPDTEIYVTVSYNEQVGCTDGSDVVGIQAPASILAPSMIGQASEAYYEEDLLFWPDRGLLPYYDEELAFRKTNLSTNGSQITADMPLGVTSDKFYEKNVEVKYDTWGQLLTSSNHNDVIVDLG